MIFIRNALSVNWKWVHFILLLQCNFHVASRQQGQWHHKSCLRKLAYDKGIHFNCPWCGDTDIFQEYMLLNGIYIPSLVLKKRTSSLLVTVLSILYVRVVQVVMMSKRHGRSVDALIGSMKAFITTKKTPCMRSKLRILGLSDTTIFLPVGKKLRIDATK